MAKYFTDGQLKAGTNGKPALGRVQGAIADAIRARQHEGRTVYHLWDGDSTTGATIYRISRPNFLEGGGRRLRSTFQVTTSGTPTTTPGVTIAGTFNPAPISSVLAQVFGAVGATDDDVTGELDETIIGTDSVGIASMCLYEDAIKDYTIADTIDSSKFAAARDVLATQTGSYGTMDQMRDRFDHTWKMRRPVFNWSTDNAEYIEFSESSEEYRYIFDQSIGDGGTAPSASGPACTLPAYACGFANFNIVRVFVNVYAAMSGNTDGGTIGIANKDANGSMQAFQDLQLPATIGGTGYAWYPSLGSFDPSTDQYFDAPIGSAFDRFCIGAKSDGSTDNVRIKAVSLFIYPSLL